jgi:hypothetical protein
MKAQQALNHNVCVRLLNRRIFLAVSIATPPGGRGRTELSSTSTAKQAEPGRFRSPRPDSGSERVPAGVPVTVLRYD